MMSFKNDRLKKLDIPMNIVKLIGKINEYKGKQELYIEQAPQILDKLQEDAVIKSTKASNSIEGIIITDKRLKEIMNDDTNLKERSEGEIAGYRDVLNTIHTSYDAIPVTSNIILQLHRDMYKYISEQGGSWKSKDSIIGEIVPNGEKFIRFKPVTASSTPLAMDSLCNFLNNDIQEQSIEPLI